MLNFRVLLLLLSFETLAASGRRYPLPPDATVTVLGNRDDGSKDAKFCRGFSLTAKEVRRHFKTYRLLNANQVHYQYLYDPCWVTGVIHLKGKSFTFDSGEALLKPPSPMVKRRP